MATILNVVDCVTAAAGGRNRNVGIGDCTFDPKAIIGMAKVPSTFKLSKADLASAATAVAALKAAAIANNPSARIYPIHNLKNPVDNSEDKVVNTGTDGSQTVVRDGMLNWTYEFSVGGLSLHQAIRSHNQNGGYWIFWDSSYRIYGWEKNNEIYGVPLQFFWANPWRQQVGDTPTIYSIQVVFDPRYVNQELGHALLNNGLSDVKGLRDIEIVVNDFDGDTGVGNFSLLTADVALNLFDTYSDEFDTPTMFTAVNKSTGGTITISALTAQTSDKTFNFTLSIADLDYPSDGGEITFKMDGVDDLVTAGVEGFEGLETTLTVEEAS